MFKGKFEIGDLIYCIDTYEVDYTTYLSYKKGYFVVDNHPPNYYYISIINDNNTVCSYRRDRFEYSLKYERKLKLDKICLSQEIK